MRNVKFILSNIKFMLSKQKPEVGSEPFMPPLEKEAFMQFANDANNILEYGGGGSTIWANRKGKLGTCVENNREWISAIEDSVAKSGFPESLTMLYANIGLTGSYGMPILGNFTLGLSKKGLIYVALPFMGAKQNKQFDLVFIDGRWRVSCALYSALMLSSEVTILLDDYEDNRRYEIISEFFDINLFGRLAQLKLKQNVDKLQLFHHFVKSLNNAE